MTQAKPDEDKLIEVMAKAAFPEGWYFGGSQGDRDRALKMATHFFGALRANGYMVIEGWKEIASSPKAEDGEEARFLVVDAEGFMDVAQTDDDFSMWDFEPTHWMPSPSPPSKEAKEQS